MGGGTGENERGNWRQDKKERETQEEWAEKLSIGWSPSAQWPLC